MSTAFPTTAPVRIELVMELYNEIAMYGNYTLHSSLLAAIHITRAQIMGYTLYLNHCIYAITRLCGFDWRGAAEAVMISQISLVELRKSIFEIEELEYIESYGVQSS